MGISGQNDVLKEGKRLKVASAEFVDHAGGKITASVWQEAYGLLSGLRVGEGVAIIACKAQSEGVEVKLNVWPGAHASTTGSQVETLASLDTSGLDTKVLPATFSPGQDLAALVEH